MCAATASSSSDTGKIVAIVVGTVIGVLLLILAAILCSYCYGRW
jgi:uncharacterized integral membrane protein